MSGRYGLVSDDGVSLSLYAPPLSVLAARGLDTAAAGLLSAALADRRVQLEFRDPDDRDRAGELFRGTAGLGVAVLGLCTLEVSW